MDDFVVKVDKEGKHTIVRWILWEQYYEPEEI